MIYDTIVTRQAFLVIFFIVILFLIGGFGNWLIPVILGLALAFPRINNIRFWLLSSLLIILLLRNLFYPFLLDHVLFIYKIIDSFLLIVFSN